MNKGFTLIEIIIYIALFSILLGSGFVTAYQLIDGTAKLNGKNTTQEEGNFVLRKLDWALSSMSTTTADVLSPSTVSPYATSSTLSIQKYYLGKKIPVVIVLDTASSSIKMQENGSGLTDITTQNVVVSKLSFKYLPAVGSAPAGIAATTTINGVDFAITKYLRK